MIAFMFLALTFNIFF
ncbi:hypothetical protein QNZ45_002235 [Enterobacter hormaechei]|nr:hypothetical protein [Enterobacter hormaechei]HDT1607755.1 hypothetical protein [Enterobacter hormaechei subsp. steigerwaltii]